jgi:outer membrane protein
MSNTYTKVLFFSLISFGLFAQGNLSGSDQPSPYSLKECIEYGIKNNINLKQSGLQIESNQISLEQAKWAKYPTLNGQYNINTNFGRNVDPFSNDVVTQGIGTNNLGIGAGVPIFNGNRLKNQEEISKLNLEASQIDLQTQTNNLSLQIAVAYLNVLSSEDLIEVAQKQAEVTKIQLERTQKLVNAGALAETNLFDLEAQSANDDLQVVNAKNSLESAILTLKQAMNLPPSMNIKPVRIQIPNPNITAVYPKSSNAIYNEAVVFLPEVKASQVRLKVADKNILIAQSLGKPSISASGSLGTNYSTFARNLVSLEPTFSAIPVSATVNGQVVPFVLNLPQQNFDRVKIPYFNQLGNNYNINLGIAARIPIFNGYNQKYQTETAKVQKRQSELEAENIKLQIRQNIDQAFINMLNAEKKYSATLSQVEALEKSYVAAEARFNAGSGTFIDYNLAKTNLDRAKANLVQTKYDYAFRIKILDFYQNKPLAF